MRVDTSQIPDLSRLEVQSENLGFRHSIGPFLGAIKPAPWHADTQLWALVMNSVRLADLAGVEYEMGRSVLATAWGNDRQNGSIVWPILRAGGHFETCITSVHRAVEHLACLKVYTKLPSNLSARLPATSNLSGKGEQQIKDMRHAIQHQEERILGASKKGPPFQQGDSWAFYPTGDDPQDDMPTSVKVIDRVELGSHRIMLRDLAQWLTELNGYARALTEVW